MRSLVSYLPKHLELDQKIVTARVSRKMAEQVRWVAYRYRWTTSEVVRAGLEKFLDELKKAELSASPQEPHEV